MNKNTSYYKAMHAKSEAASPLSKIYGTTHNKKVHDSAMEMSHMKKHSAMEMSHMKKMDDPAMKMYKHTKK